MILSIKSGVLIGSLILTGLSAGLFYAWSVSVIPGTRKLTDLTYLETMQSINRAILNPAFFAIFFGSLILLGISSIYQFQSHREVFGLMLAAAVVYLIGTVGVTGLGNVPLNNQLDAMDLGEASTTKLAEFRAHYESQWNWWHSLRTAFAVLSFLLAVLSLFLEVKKS
ncbi:MAG: DUF1772 domain-containing protein [Bacteroidota bacterium]